MVEQSKMYTHDRNLALELVRVTEAAALASSRWIGRGDEKAADQAAVDGMRNTLNELNIQGTVVIGEGERDEAPMLYIGEEVGTGVGPEIDIALDPLEGTTICATGGANSLAVLAVAERGNFLNAPDVYMQKIAVGGGLPAGIVDLDNSVSENVKAVAKARGKSMDDMLVCVLDRPRHQDIIDEIRSLGARIKLIGDGDVAGVIETADPESDVEMYIGTGGAPEGVLAAAALRCVGGQIQGRLLFRNDVERERAAKWGVEDLDRKYNLDDMATGDVVFAATGVTDGGLLKGVRLFGDRGTTESLVMRSKTGTVRRVHAEHNFDRKDWMR